jgi:hypothetical protein
MRSLSLPQTRSDWRIAPNRAMLHPMGDMLKLIWWAVIGLFRSRVSLEAEILTLRHQLTVLRRKSPKRLAFSNFDRLIFTSLYRIAPRVVNALAIVEPATVIRWHGAGFRLFWRWKSRCRSGRPKVSLEIRQLIRDMSLANPLWGAPRIHGELLKLGIDVGQTSVAKRMGRPAASSFSSDRNNLQKRIRPHMRALASSYFISTLPDCATVARLI